MKTIEAFDPLERYLEDVKENIEAKGCLENWAKNQKDGDLLCPRCGRKTMKSSMELNGISMHGPINICPDCQKDEELRSYIGMYLSPKDWVVFRNHITEAEA